MEQLVSNIKSFEELTAFSVVLAIVIFGLFLVYKLISRQLRVQIESSQAEMQYYRKKIDEKDEEIKKITEEFTKILTRELRDMRKSIERGQ